MTCDYLPISIIKHLFLTIDITGMFPLFSKGNDERKWCLSDRQTQVLYRFQSRTRWPSPERTTQVPSFSHSLSSVW